MASGAALRRRHLAAGAVVRAAGREAVRARRHPARRPAGGRPLCRRVHLHLPGADAHHRLAPDRVPLHLSLRRGAAAAALRAGRAAAPRAVGRPGDRLRGGGAGLQRGLHRPARARATARRRAGAGSRHALGPDHAGDPQHRAGDGERREDPLLPGGGDGPGGAAALAGPGRNVVAAVLGLRLAVAGLADGDRRLRQLPRLDVAAAALPGHPHVVLHLPHAGLRAGVRGGAAEGAAHAAAGAGPRRRRRGHPAGEPQGLREGLPIGVCAARRRRRPLDNPQRFSARKGSSCRSASARVR